MAKTTNRPTMRKQIPVAALLSDVRKLARDGLNQKQIAAKLGFKTTATQLARLVALASQRSGRPVPVICRGGNRTLATRRVEIVEVMRRAAGLG